MPDGPTTPEGEVLTPIDQKRDNVSTIIKKVSEPTTPVDFNSIRQGVGLNMETGGLEPDKSVDELEEKNNKLQRDNETLREDRDAIQDSKEALLAEKEALEEAHGVDSLTGLFNRRYVEIEAARLDAQRKVHGINYAVALIDLDTFKNSANDKYGHPVGDEVLKYFASVLTSNLRDEDIPGRYGGDEFIALLPVDPGKDTIHLENLEARLDSQLRKVLSDKYPQLTELQKIGVSVGVASSSDENPKFDKIVQEADRLLYERKNSKGLPPRKAKIVSEQ